MVKQFTLVLLQQMHHCRGAGRIVPGGPPHGRAPGAGPARHHVHEAGVAGLDFLQQLMTTFPSMVRSWCSQAILFGLGVLGRFLNGQWWCLSS